MIFHRINGDYHTSSYVQSKGKKSMKRFFYCEGEEKGYHTPPLTHPTPRVRTTYISYGTTAAVLQRLNLDCK